MVTIVALSDGVDRAQEEVLKPLTGVGSDLSVTRPLQISASGEDVRGGPANLSREEREKLLEENQGARRFSLEDLGEPGERFETDRFVSSTQLSFPERDASEIASLPGVATAAPALTLNAVHVEGKVPESPSSPGGGGPGVGGPGVGGIPRDIDFDSSTVTGVDVTNPEVAPVTPAQITKGRFLSSDPKRREAVLTESYAGRVSVSVGEDLILDDRQFRVVGLAKPPIGGRASDSYIELGELQKLSDRKRRVNTVQVRATDAGAVSALAKEIDKVLPGAEVTTAEGLGDRVGGSLTDARNLADRLGTALAIITLIAALAIAGLLTLSSIAKRTRELGTLKALGWSRRLVVRQVAGESLAQGLIGGAVGIGLALLAVVVINAFAPTLTASVAASEAPVGPIGIRFGQGQITSGSETVALDLSVSGGLLLLAVGLAILGGLVAGAVGGLRAAQLSPADALRQVE